MTQLAILPRDQFPKKVPANPLEARLAIARDVLEHLESKKLYASRGVYISFRDYDDVGYADSFEQLAVSLYSTESQTKCSVCAIGAACMVAVGLYDDAETLEQEWSTAFDDEGENANPMDIGLDSSGMHEVLGQWFSKGQLALIECAFEGTEDWCDPSLKEEEIRRAADFRHKDEYSSEETMQDIFQNILNNNGTFVP